MSLPDAATKLTELSNTIDAISVEIAGAKQHRHATIGRINRLKNRYSKKIIKIDPDSRDSVTAQYEIELAELRRDVKKDKNIIEEKRRSQKSYKTKMDQIQLAVIHEAKEKRGGQYTSGSLPETSLSPITRFRLFNSLFGIFRDKDSFKGFIDSREKTLLNRLVAQNEQYSPNLSDKRLDALKAAVYEDALTVAECECGLRPSKKGDKPLARVLVELAENDLNEGVTQRYKKPKGEKAEKPEPEEEPEI